MISKFQQCGILTIVGSDELLQPPFKLRNSKCCSVSGLTHRIVKRLAMALIRLRVCAGWSEALLVEHTTLLEILCHSSHYSDEEGQVSNTFCTVRAEHLISA